MSARAPEDARRSPDQSPIGKGTIIRHRGKTVHNAKPGHFICADCHHERDLLSNIARTISGRVYCGGCATKKHRVDRALYQAAESEAAARTRPRAAYLA